MRAARHYEGASQVLLRKVVMSSKRFISMSQGELPPLEEWHEVECPARLDLAGEKMPRCGLQHLQLLADSFSTSQAAGATRRPSPLSTVAA